MKAKKALFLISMFVWQLLLATQLQAQSINFGLFAGQGITLTPGSVPALDFNAARQWIASGAPAVTLPLTHHGAAVIAITAQRDLDIVVTISAPPSLQFDAANTVPVTIRFAYSNLGATNEAIARAQAIEVPIGFSSITFPVVRRIAGAPGPPPTPPHPGYTAPTGTAYLFIYGTLGHGTIPPGLRTGLYSGVVNIHVAYAN